MKSLSVEGVGAAYGSTRVLDDISFHVDRGEMLAVLGPSGCGKTTLLRSIAGLHRIDTGSIMLGEQLIDQPPRVYLPPEHRRIGLMPQEGGLFPHLSVGRNVGFGLVRPSLRSMFGDRKARRARVEELLELVGLAHTIDARPRELSGGQQQRVALARALAPRPTVLLMDEPFAALDAGLRTSIRSEVRAMLREQKVASILVTHDQAEAMGSADRVAVLLAGRCAQIGEPEHVYRAPVTREVAAFVGEAQFVAAARTGSHAETVFGKVAVLGEGHGCGEILIRPEQVRLVSAPDGQFQVGEVQFSGPESIVTVHHRESEISVRASVRGEVPYGIGSIVRAEVAQPLAFFDSPSTTL
ncbi:iron(III) transport system ATP-binding protein [Rhodococcus sp. SMB37]|uniref:ABC transporter ATP-binding protein n=1 Tax=Rhodococcus sp. SMB37 TaxID=2512213 RepID=UPI0010477B33|nr:ABC transporter ATP-binding protein [Rhodococcus sp. SMB37]TCN52752.1 iron(III) transport system ATP-binding protein [Rhodococcus sp. SMB37]